MPRSRRIRRHFRADRLVRVRPSLYFPSDPVTTAFYLLAALTLGAALGVALSRHIVHAAFALMATLLGVAGLFVLLVADFLGVVQLLVYVGGILVLTVFAIMLTHRIGDVRVSNRSVGRLPAALLAAAVLAALVRTGTRATWAVQPVGPPAPTTARLGDAFLGTWVLPFEVASLVLLVALIAAVTLSRKELRGA
jgi:NAD(P)H-quinone oxidoreductase subunit 6